MSDWEKYKISDLPTGKSGNWTIERFEISQKDADFGNLRASFSFSNRGSYLVPGQYTRLMRGGKIIMSDTYDEIKDHLPAIRMSKGNCLIGGMGLGVVTNACLQKPEVEHVTVIEFSEDVIQLVGEHYAKKFGDKLTIVNADIMTWKPPKGFCYDMAWFDIWDDICEDNLPSMSKLKRRFARNSEWKGCWREREIKGYKNRRSNWGGFGGW